MLNQIFQDLHSIQSISKPVIGMIHLQAMPGTPAYKGSVKEIVRHAIEEAIIYQKAGINGLMIENMHDTPYIIREIGNEVSSLMGIIGYEIKKQTKLPCGIQILAGANKAALAVANSAGLDFIRAEGFVFGHVADEGWMDADAGDLLRYRKMIGAEQIAIFTDIKKKHSAHALTADIDIVETAKAATFFRSDGLIITGKATGLAADLEEIKAVKENTKLPILIGSGITLENLETYFSISDAFIVGSWFKKNGYWENELEAQKVSDFMEKVKVLSSQSLK